MIKILSVFVSVFLLFIGSVFFHPDETVTIQPYIPPSVKPGAEFTVELTVTKGSIAGFAQLQQYLPEGFTAVAVETMNATFDFNEHLVRFVWKELPADKSFRISYKVKTDETCNGVKTLNGEFSYIENDQPKKIALTPSVIMLSNDLLVSDSSAAEPNKEITAKKYLFTSKTKKGSYQVELKISKGIRQSAARIFDKVIPGYGAEIIDAKGARFSYTNGMAEFYWEALPRDSVFTISYFLVPDSSMNSDYSITSLIPQNNSTESSTPVSSTDRNFTSNSTHDQQTAEASHPAAITGIPAPQKGIYYKIQIAATKHSPERKSDYFRLKYNITEPVEITMHEGWKKYLVGGFEKYASAKQKNEQTKSKIPDSFIVAYNDEYRIPLREALKPKNRNQ